MNMDQFARSEYQIKLLKVHHFNFDSCQCPKPHGQHWNCIFDCCKYEFSETAKLLKKKG